MKIGIRVPALLAGFIIIASFGCDSDSFVPPPPAELRGGAGGAAPSVKSTVAASSSLPTAPIVGKAVELVLARHEGDEAEGLKGAARTQAGNENARIKVALLSNQDPQARQVELVREALARHPLALIVEPLDPGDPALAGALHEAQRQKIPVILIGRGLTTEKPAADTGDTPSSTSPPSPATRSDRPITVVAPAPFAPTAQLLVASALRNAKNANFSTEGGAAILYDTQSDPFIADRVREIKTALKAAGINTIHELPFETQGGRARAVLTDHLAANPKTALVFSLDFLSFAANREVADEIAEKRPFISATYTTDDHITGIAMYGEFAAIAQLGGTRLLRKAVTTAVAAGQGRDQPARVEVPITFFDTPPGVGLPRVMSASGPKKKMNPPR